MKALYTGMILILLAAIAVNGMCEKNSNTGTIVITIVDARPSQEGTIIVALSDSEESWLKLDKAFVRTTIPVTADSMIVKLSGIPYSNAYAIQVIHDKNDNGKFDMRWFPYPKPKEGAGVSNNNTGFGPPDYDEARFELSEPHLSLRIRMIY
jgi:uncharacterized protein (DUF2141 family)